MIHALVVAARERLIRAGIPPDQASIDAEVLARHVLGWDRAEYLTRRHEPFPEQTADRFEAAPGAYSRGFAAMYRFQGGQIAERWAVRDDLTMLRQLGAFDGD